MSKTELLQLIKFSNDTTLNIHHLQTSFFLINSKRPRLKLKLFLFTICTTYLHSTVPQCNHFVSYYDPTIIVVTQHCQALNSNEIKRPYNIATTKQKKAGYLLNMPAIKYT